MLDPALCKDLKHYEKAVEAHRQWCMKEWLPVQEVSSLPVDGKFVLSPPSDIDEVRSLYKKLALDFPQVMDFVPS